MKDLRISVVIPAWNAAPYIGRTLDGVLGQTHAVEEIIVSDDASTDGTGDVVHEYSRKHGERVRYIRHEHVGCGGSRNIGIHHARYDWIALHDADDVWFPHKIQSQIRILENNSTLKWCGCGCQVQYPDRVIQPVYTRDVRQKLDQGIPVPFFANAIKSSISPNGTSAVLHRSLFAELGYFDESLPLMEDRDMWWRIALRYPLIGFCPDICCCYHKGVPMAMTDLNVRGRGRNVEATILLRYLREARKIGGGVVADYRSMADVLAYDFLFREAGGQASIDPHLVRQMLDEFDFSTRQRLTLKLIRILPRRLAFRFVDRFRL